MIGYLRMFAGVGAFMSAVLPRSTESKIRPKRAQKRKVMPPADCAPCESAAGKPVQVSTENAAKPAATPSAIQPIVSARAGTAIHGAIKAPRKEAAQAELY